MPTPDPLLDIQNHLNSIPIPHAPKPPRPADEVPSLFAVGDDDLAEIDPEVYRKLSRRAP